MMGKIAWCMGQKNGIRIADPNENLCRSYMAEADQTLDAVSINKGKWKIITSYYACYNAVYALLMKAGITSEIHDCTIALMGLFGFSDSDVHFLSELKDNRINVQYYLKEPQPVPEQSVKQFVLRCKELLSSMDGDKINILREGIGRK
jgi:uncharacterized protein (UPF0332 family)